jgi:DNA-binding GntR family transcriptional regulator
MSRMETAASRPVLEPIGRHPQRQRASDRVYEELAAAIGTLRLEPGATLSETELAQQLQVSRTPLREAIARLVDTGLVTVVPQVGTMVERISLRDVEEARFIRESLETSVFTVACKRHDRDLTELRELLAEQRRAFAKQDLDAFFEADDALHQQIFTNAGYPGAWQSMQPMKLKTDRLRRLSLPAPATVRALIEEHTAIVDALGAGDVRGGHATIRKHVGRMKEFAPAIVSDHPGFFTD